MAITSNFIAFALNKLDSTDTICKECFSIYDTDKDGALSYDECCKLFKDLLQSKTNVLTEDDKHTIFNLLDEDKDGRICENDFRRCVYYWLKQTLKPVSAFVIVDVQNDFIDGSLALRNCPGCQEGLDVIPVINQLLDTVQFDVVVYTKDWHPDDHISFIENVAKRPFSKTCKIMAQDAKIMDTVEFEGPPKKEQRLWPKHCVCDTWGSKLHSQLKVCEAAKFVYKGCHSEVDSYSAFWDNNKLSQTELVQILSNHKVTDVYVCGVAYDVCVSYTALHSLEHGFRTVIIDDACRGVETAEIQDTKRKLVDAGGIIVHSSQVKEIVTGEDRPSALGLQTAKNVALARELVNHGIVK